MNVEKCLGDAADAGKISRAGAEKALREVRRIMAENPATSEAEAMAAAAETLTREAKAQKRQVAMQALASFRNDTDLAAHPDGIGAGVRGIFARDISGKGNQFSVEGRAQSLRGIMHGMIADALDAYRSKTLGLTRDTTGLIRFVREIYGEATGDGLAAAATRGWVKATDWGAAAFNAAGGNLQRKEAWRLPQEWDSAAVKAGGRTKFLDFMDQEIAGGGLRIVDWETGKPLDALRRAELISNAYERISTDGLSDLVPGRQVNTKLANARTEKRAFEWTNADAWLRFNRTYGKGDNGIFDVITGHVDGMAQDIAMLQRLGPNPAAEARRLLDVSRKDGTGPMRQHWIEATWDHVSGAAASPVADWLAKGFGGVRAWLASAQLGSAVLSAATDFSTLRAAAAWNGLSRNSVMGEYVSLLASEKAQMRAVRSGLIADGWAQRARAAQRTMMEEIGQTLPARVAGFVMRASGLEAHTQAGKWAFGMEFLGHLADNAGRAMDALDPTLRATMQRYGITPEDWDLIRARGVLDEDGVRHIYPEQIIREVSDRPALDATMRLMDMINTERGFAILEAGAVERSLLLGKTRPGTPEGEFLRSSAQYKAFPVTMMTRHMARGLNAGDHGKYMVGLVVSLTAMGALAMQLKAVSQGRDPRDMTDWKFWGAAFFQGGGAGILGDFLNSSLTRADRSFYMTAIGGPTAGLMDDLAKLTGANITATAEGKDANFGRDLANFVRRNTPGTSLWYSRLAVDRLMWDRVQELADPEYQRAFRRIEDRARRENNQQFWWGPGDRGPERAPAMGAAIGAEP
jgi:hypothetical protein